VQAARQVAPLAQKTVPLAQQAAQRTVPLAQQAAQQAVPLARSAGTSVRQGADGAVAWAAPKVDAARAWAAPQLEQSAHAISESLAPMISSALMSAAQKIDAPQAKKSRSGRKIIGAVLLAAAAGAAAVAAMRFRPKQDGYSSDTTIESGDAAPAGGYGQGPVTEDSDGPDPDLNGHPRIV
jgi:hypothetical protein